ncbi:MAG: cation:dicarboxylase symporter family transporter [Bryobacterales bacterium]|nr:cation:dicarboxylase symporter family transporter [Bryobacterales bacterium]
MKRISITAWIFIGMAAGIALGVFFPGFSKNLTPISNIFLRLIKSVLAPLLFGTLVAGIAGSGSVKTMGRIGGKAILYFEIVTTLALLVGLAAVNIAKPGVGVPLDRSSGEQLASAPPPSIGQLLEHTFPVSVIDAMAKGEVLQLVVFCFMFGAACVAVGAKAKPIVEWAESLAEIMFRYTHYVMLSAPFAVCAALAATVGAKGLGVLLGLGKLILTLYVSLIVFVLFVLVPVMIICRIPIRRFYEAVKEPWLIAFSTSTSEAALPIALENMEKFGVPKHIVGFVLPTGYSFNLDGTTLYLSLASVFVAQAAGVDLTIGQQILIMLTLMLTSKGVAGVPRASLVILSGTLVSFHLPVEGVALILGVDAVMDMARTSVNVLGNCLASAVVARWEGVDLSKPPVEQAVLTVSH